MTLDTTSSHELLWAIKPLDEEDFDARAYCRCGWLSPEDELARTPTQRQMFIDHLEDLQSDEWFAAQQPPAR